MKNSKKQKSTDKELKIRAKRNYYERDPKSLLIPEIEFFAAEFPFLYEARPAGEKARAGKRSNEIL